MKPKGSLAHSQHSAIYRCAEPKESSSCLPITFLYDAL